MPPPADLDFPTHLSSDCLQCSTAPTSFSHSVPHLPSLQSTLYTTTSTSCSGPSATVMSNCHLSFSTYGEFPEYIKNKTMDLQVSITSSIHGPFPYFYVPLTSCYRTILKWIPYLSLHLWIFQCISVKGLIYTHTITLPLPHPKTFTIP